MLFYANSVRPPAVSLLKLHKVWPLRESEWLEEVL